jgi:hypothetical protein
MYERLWTQMTVGIQQLTIIHSLYMHIIHQDHVLETLKKNAGYIYFYMRQRSPFGHVGQEPGHGDSPALTEPLLLHLLPPQPLHGELFSRESESQGVLDVESANQPDTTKKISTTKFPTILHQSELGKEKNHGHL